MLIRPSELFKACSIIFKGSNINSNFIKSMSMDDLKRHYRETVKNIHPDLYYGNDESEKKRRELMLIELNQAYELITSYIIQQQKVSNNKSFSNNTQPFYQSHTKSNSFESTTLNMVSSYSQIKNLLPKRKLMFGEFLYYSKAISWEDLVKAIVWQRKQRDRLGEIAMRWGLLKKYEIDVIIKYRQPRELIGQLFLRFKKVNELKLRALIYQQQKEQPKIGTFFEQANILGPEDLDRYEYYFKYHNSFF